MERQLDNKIKVGIIFGTRPEAIKMAPLVLELKKRSEFDTKVIVTAQHRQMLDQVLDLFEIKPDYDLDLMKDNQNLWNLTSDILVKTKEVFEKENFDVVLVHGDTTTAFASSLSAFYAKIKIGHVEAGLRTFDKFYPYPEEMNRVFADYVTDFYFAPTDRAVQNLIDEKCKKENIFKTGNTVIDALLWTVKNKEQNLDFLNLDNNLKTILVTSHRRENFGEPLENICSAILKIVENNKDVQVIYPVHLNPNVRKIVNSKLKDKERIILTDPMDYAPFASLMKKSHIILTDSGGVQEEAPSLGVPVLVLRSETERPEAIEYGGVRLVGWKKDNIISNVQELLDNKDAYNSMAHAVNPYGDGLASKRIADVLIYIK